MERPFPLKWEWPSLGNQGSLLWLSDLQHPLVVAWLPLAPPEARTQHTAHLSSTARTHRHTDRTLSRETKAHPKTGMHTT